MIQLPLSSDILAIIEWLWGVTHSMKCITCVLAIQVRGFLRENKFPLAYKLTSLAVKTGRTRGLARRQNSLPLLSHLLDIMSFRISRGSSSKNNKLQLVMIQTSNNSRSPDIYKSSPSLNSNISNSLQQGLLTLCDQGYTLIHQGSTYRLLTSGIAHRISTCTQTIMIVTDNGKEYGFPGHASRVT